MKIGNKKRNFALESQQQEMQENDKLIVLVEKSEGGITNIDLILEPNRFDKLGSECRLTHDEYCEVINKLVDDEEDEWDELRMKDMVNLTRDAIIEATIFKYAKEHYEIEKSQLTGSTLDYNKRYDEQGRFLGEAVIVTCMRIPSMDMRIR